MKILLVFLFDFNVMKLSNSGLQKPLKFSKFCISSEILMSEKVTKFQSFDKKIAKIEKTIYYTQHPNACLQTQHWQEMKQ